MNLLLEGDDLEALLLRAHREGGTAARIVRAQKVRRGGILGFFAKEGFEVAVEIPKDGESDSDALRQPAVEAVASTFTAMPQLTGSVPPAAIEAGGSLGGGLLGLADRTSAAERAATLAITGQVAYESAIRAAVDTVDDVTLDTRSGRGGALPAGSSPAERLAAKFMPSRTLALVESDFVEPDFVKPDFVETDFVEAVFVEAVFNEAVIDEAVFSEAGFDEAGFDEAVFSEAGFDEAVFDEAGFDEAGFDGAMIIETELVEPNFVEPRIVEADFALAEIVEILASEMPPALPDPVRVEEAAMDSTAQAVVFTAIEFPHVQFPEDQAWPAPSLALSMSGAPSSSGASASAGGTSEPPVIVNGLAANSTASATTVAPMSRPGRGGHRAVPSPRPTLDDAPYGSALDRPGSGSSGHRSGQHAAKHGRQDSAFEGEVVDAQSSAATSWKLLRRWRPGLRRQAIEGNIHFRREVDPNMRADHDRPDTDHWTHLAGPVSAVGGVQATDAVENSETRTTVVVLPDGVVTPFADAATLGDVPAGTHVIEGFDQLTSDREALRALGVPAAWTEHLHAGDRFGSIVAMLDQLAEPRIREDAAVIAVVGPADVVELEAHRTALDLPSSGRPRAVTLEPGAVGVDRRAAIARRKRIRPVVISVPIDGYDDPAGTRKALTSIKAEAVIVVVDASRPLDEITSWVQALEQVDAIALNGALDVKNPAAVLGLDVPVIRVDGIAVDRIGWAALLCAQLAMLDASR